MKKLIALPACLLLLLAATANGSAQAVAIRFDPSQSKVLWTLADVLHTVHGAFQLASGNITFDPKNGDATGLFTVNEDTGQSGDSTRDNRMKKSLLKTAQYPTATFRPTHVSGALKPNGVSNLVVTGIFHLYGADHPLQLNFKVNTSGQAVAATTHFEIPYVAWGMRDPSTLFLRVGKSVEMEIDATGVLQPQK